MCRACMHAVRARERVVTSVSAQLHLSTHDGVTTGFSPLRRAYIMWSLRAPNTGRTEENAQMSGWAQNTSHTPVMVISVH